VIASSTTMFARVLSGAALLGVRQIAGLLGTVGAAFFLIRTYGLGGYGQLTLAMGVSGMFGILAGNYDEVLRRFLPEYLSRGARSHAAGLVRSVLSIRFCTTGIAALALAISSGHLEELYEGVGVDRALFVLASVQVVTSSFERTVASLFSGMQLYRPLAVIAVVQATGTVLIALYAWLGGVGLRDYYLAWLVFNLGVGAVSLVAGVAKVIRSFPSEDATPRDHGRELRRHLSYAVPLWGSWIGSVAYQHLARSVLGAFAPASAVGAYSLAKSAVEQLVGVVMQVPTAMLPAFSDLATESGARVAAHRIEAVSRLAGPIMAASLIVVICLAEEVLSVFAGTDATFVAGIFALLVLQVPARILTSIWGTLYFIHERTSLVLKLNLLRVIALAGVGALLAATLGVDGAAWSETVAFGLGYAFVVATAPRHLAVPSSAVVRGGRLGFALLLGAALVIRFGHPPMIWRIALALGALACMVPVVGGRMRRLRTAEAVDDLIGRQPLRRT